MRQEAEEALVLGDRRSCVRLDLCIFAEYDAQRLDARLVIEQAAWMESRTVRSSS